MPKTGFDARTITVFAFFIVAGIFGGGGSRFPMQEMLVYIAALPALYFVFTQHRDAADKTHFRFARLLTIGLILLVLAQIIPLPPAIWQSLPGRETLADAANVLGQADSWRPWSINPEKTLSAALYLIIPITAFWCVAALSRENQVRLFWCIMGVAVVHILVSAAQAVSGGESFYMYQTTHKGLPIGIFANRNHTGMFFLICLIFSPVLMATKLSQSQSHRKILFWIIAIILASAIIATSSRAVTILTAASFIFLAALSLPPRLRKTGIWGIAIMAIVLLVAILAAWSTDNLGNLNQLGDRFEQSEDYRYEFWPETITTAAHYFPFGSGIGTFDAAFRSQEPLDIVGTHFVNHAHNDYIELVIENGVLGIFIIIALAAAIAPAIRYIFQNYLKGKLSDLPVLAVWAAIMLILHSLVDYPLRSLSIAALCGAIMAVILSVKTGKYDNVQDI